MPFICLNCGVAFEGQRSSRQFCSDNCRVKFNQKRKKESTQKAFEECQNVQLPIPSNLPDPDKKFPPFERKSNPSLELNHSLQTAKVVGVPYDPLNKYALELGHRLLDWCSDKPLTAEDVFVWLDENYGKKPDPAKKAEKNDPGEEKKETTVPKFQNDLWERKMGIKKA